MPIDAPVTHAADRLLAAIDARHAPVCVGLDPVIERLPQAVRRRAETSMHSWFMSDFIAVADYCIALLAAIAPHVPCVKLQSACFERYGEHGLALLHRLVAQAHSLDLQVILDAKRGDIGISAQHYAAAAFDRNGPNSSSADWLTINSYLGDDGIRPFLKPGHGAFALVRTSNPGGDAVQNLQLNDGRTVAHAVAELIAGIGDSQIGQRGYSSLGAVVGATKRHDAATLRRIMPRQLFLVPGYGAQGGSIDDILPCFNPDRTGAIITASRSVIYSFDPDDENWSAAVSKAAATFVDDIRRGLAQSNRNNG